jgi:4-hydroxybenzoate polyprenyltransferase
MAATTIAPRQSAAGAAFRMLGCIRLGEVLMQQGTPLLGAVFAMGPLTVAGGQTLAWLAAGNTALMAHVFVLNDWSGEGHDLRDPHRRDGVFTNRGVGRNAVAFLALGLLVLALLALRQLGDGALSIGVAIAGLSALYSFPGIHMKGIPVLGTALHLAGGLLHFLLGYAAFATPDWRGVQIGGFFALVLMAGHLTQETRDIESDLANGIRTNAVRFGKRRSFLGGLALFTLANVWLVGLALGGMVPRLLAGVVAVLPLHLYWSRQAVRAGLGFEAVRRLQARYRVLYVAIGVWMVGTLLVAGRQVGSFL